MNDKLHTRSADVHIVGSGLTGLLLGAGLTQAGMKVAIRKDSAASLPATVCSGMLTALPALQRIESAWKTRTAAQYAAALQEQLMALLTAPPAYVQERDAYRYATAYELPALRQQQALMQRLGLPVSIAPDAGGCPFPVELSLTAQGHALVNLPKWMAALRSAILRGGGQIVTENNLFVNAPITVYTGDIPPGFSSPLLLERRMLAHCILTGGPPLHSLQLPLQEGLVLLPCREGLQVLFDAGRCGMPDQQDRLERFPVLLSRRLPDWRQDTIRYDWVIATTDGLPLIGALPGSRHLCAIGETGILGAMHAASVLMRYILGQATPEDRIYAPDRALPTAVLGAQRRKLRQIRISNLTRWRAPLCSHCSCRMRYSPSASWWECPYCASVFDMFGQVLLGPARYAARASPCQRPDL